MKYDCGISHLFESYILTMFVRNQCIVGRTTLLCNVNELLPTIENKRRKLSIIFFKKAWKYATHECL